MRHPIPRAALDDRLGFIGTSGSGKTYNAGTAIEILLSSAARVVIIDPLGVWWGLRLLADGKKPSLFNVAIFGGPHGDLPLTEHAGALIGETAATMAESCIIDLSELKTRTAERRFMVAFLETIYRSVTGEPFHLIVDEADLFAPQKPQSGDEVLLGHMENIVRRGRVKGFIPWLISQRPAVLNKNVLSMVDGLLAFKLTSPQDRDALDAWIEGQADKAQGKEIKGSLPALEIGQGVVWLPGHGILRTASFPQKVTYDSSRKLKRGEKSRRTKPLKPVDLGRLKDKLAKVVEEAKANDPRALRSEIAALKAERDKLAKAKAGKAAPNPDAIKQDEARGFGTGEKATRASAEKTIKSLRAALEAAMKFIVEINAKDFFKAGGESVEKKAVEKAITEATGHITRLIEQHLGRRDKQIELLRAEAHRVIERLKTVVDQDVNIKVDIRHNEPFTISAGKGQVRQMPLLADSDGNLERPLQTIINAIRWWNVLGVEAPSHAQVAFVAGYSHKSGTWSTYLSRLRSLGLIEGRGDLVLTSEGAAAAQEPPSPPTDDQLRAIVLAKIDGSLSRILIPILEAYPNGLSHQEVADQAGYSAQSGTWSTYLSRLRSLDLIESRGDLKAQHWLFPMMAAA